MATTNTDVYAGQISGLHAGLPTGTQTGAQPSYLTATYTTLGTEAAADTINVGNLPIGARLLAAKSRVSSGAVGGTTATIATLGDSASASRYSATAVGITSAGSAAFTPVAANEIALYVTTPTTNTIIATLGLASGSFTAGVKVVFVLEYLLP